MRSMWYIMWYILALDEGSTIRVESMWLNSGDATGSGAVIPESSALNFEVLSVVVDPARSVAIGPVDPRSANWRVGSSPGTGGSPPGGTSGPPRTSLCIIGTYLGNYSDNDVEHQGNGLVMFFSR